MLRKLSFLAVFVGVLAPCGLGRVVQEQPSLADVARQARKDKEKNTTPKKTVVTDDSLPSGHDLGGLGISETSGTANPLDAAAGLQRAEFALNKLEPMDRATLARAVLDGNTADFPNRSNWEEKLFSAKQVYVAHSRELIRQMKQLLAVTESMKSEAGQGKMSPDDPRVQALIRKTQEILQDAVHTETTFQVVVTEGQDLAKQANHR